MTADLRNLEPTLLWTHFGEISKIPRCSESERAVGDYVVSVAERNGLAHDRDAAGNIVVRKPASPGHEGAATVVLQGHLDMVCEKDAGVEHNFAADPLDLEIEGEWVTARGTTLGADNGIGVAAALAILEDPSVVHGPLECLCTVNEETGLTGARHLQPGFLAGRLMINLDADKDGVFTIGCAGGGDSRIVLPTVREPAPPGTALAVSISGLRGGHSGIDIDKGRGNAIRLLARLLYRLGKQVPTKLASLDGGNKRNAIPREAKATMVVADGDVEQARAILKECLADIQAEYKAAEEKMELMVEPQPEISNVLGAESQHKVFGLLFGFPTGVLAMSQIMPGLVETSTNLGVVSTEESAVRFYLSTRSSVASALEAVRDAIRAISEAAGASVDQPPGYPGWAPQLDSPLLDTTSGVYKNLFGTEPKANAVHAGIETGIIGEKFPGMDMISIGPWIEDPHSPNERVQIPSVARLWQLLTTTLEALS